MMKFFVTWLVSMVLVVGGLWVVRDQMDNRFLATTQQDMIVDMSEDRIKEIECKTMSADECQWVRQMLFLTYTSKSAAEYRALIAANPEPSKWDKATTVAIEEAYQGAIQAGSGGGYHARMETIDKHYQMRDFTVKASVIFTLILTLVVGRAALKSRPAKEV